MPRSAEWGNPGAAWEEPLWKNMCVWTWSFPVVTPEMQGACCRLAVLELHAGFNQPRCESMNLKLSSLFPAPEKQRACGPHRCASVLCLYEFGVCPLESIFTAGACLCAGTRCPLPGVLAGSSSSSGPFGWEKPSEIMELTIPSALPSPPWVCGPRCYTLTPLEHFQRPWLHHCLFQCLTTLPVREFPLVPNPGFALLGFPPAVAFFADLPALGAVSALLFPSTLTLYQRSWGTWMGEQGWGELRSNAWNPQQGLGVINAN